MSGTLLAKLQAPEAERCCALCDAVLACEGYVFHLDECYLKRDLSFPTSKQGAITRLRLGARMGPLSSSVDPQLRGSSSAKAEAAQGSQPSSEAQPSCRGYGGSLDNTDISGVLIAKIWSPSSDRCCALCEERSDCEGYVFHLDQCYLKKELAATSFKQDAVTRVKVLSKGSQPSSEAQPSCPGYGEAQDNTDISGVLLAKIQSPSSDRCCALCEERSDCEGYVFHLDQCYLKADLAATSFKQDAVTRVKAPPGCAGYSPEIVNIDMSGTLLAKLQAPEAERCCALCDAVLACEGYVFHLDECYLKRDLSFPTSKQGAITRLRLGARMGPLSSSVDPQLRGSSSAKAEAAQGSQPSSEAQPSCRGYGGSLDNTDISGVLIAKIWSPSSDRCCALCEERSDCEGYVFHLDQCYLKKELAATSFKQDAVTRVKVLSKGSQPSSEAQPSCPGYGEAQDNTDISGVLLAKIQSPSSDRCCALCEERSDCEGYVFHLDQCYLKRELAATTFKQDAVTRVKVPSSCAEYTPEVIHIDMSGALLAMIPAPDAKRCCALCDAVSACEGYVFYLDECYLKRDLSTPTPKPGAITRLRVRSSPGQV